MAIKKFAHGGDVLSFAKELRCGVDEIIDLSSNINFIKPKITIDFNSLNISSYPNYDELYRTIANNYTTSKDQLELFNGGSSGIFSLFRLLQLQTCTIYSPAYLEYKRAAINFGYKLHMINRFDNFDENPTPYSLVIFVNPSTPDGMLYDIKELLDKWAQLRCTVLIDESFLEFCEGQSAIQYLEEFPNLYILKSMTKFYNSAGVRLGAIISKEENIKRLKTKEPAWKISQFDSLYIQEVLKDTTFKQIAKEQNDLHREKLFTLLSHSSLFETVFPSSANFFLLKLQELTASEFQEKLKPYKILIRDCSNFDFLDESYVRIAVKSLEDINILEKALKQL